MGFHLVGQFAAADSFNEAGVDVDALGGAGLAPDAALLDDQSLDPLSGGIQGRAESGGAAAHDHQVVRLSFGFGADAQFGRQFGVGRFDEYRADFKDYGRDDLLAVVQLLDALAAFFVFVNVDPIVADTLLAKKLLR
jgi:hypothetical protein